MKVLIADDEKLARCRLKRLIAELDDDVDVVGEAINGIQVLQKWKQTGAEILLLDIQMPEMDGLQVAQELIKFPHSPAIIFTTAYDSYALQAFEANAVDYLLKPIRKDRLNSALQKAQALQKSQWEGLKNLLPKQNYRSHLCVSIGNDLHVLAVSEILYFHAEQKYISVKTSEREYLLDESLKTLEEEFTGVFLRIHRNALVSLAHIEELHKQSDGQVLVKFHHSSETLTVSRRLVAKVKHCLKKFKLSQD